MFRLTFNCDQARLQQWATARTQTVLQQLRDRVDKNFTVSLNNVTYRLRYEINEHDLADLYLIRDDNIDDANLVRPRLQLNIGEFLLPESLSLDYSPKGLNPTVYNPSVIEFGTSEPTAEEVASLKAYITSVGLTKLLSNF